MKTITKWVRENNIQGLMLGLAVFWSLNAALLEFVARIMTGEENPSSPTLFYLSATCYFIHRQMKDS